MVIAAGPRVVNSSMGPIPYAEAAERRGHLQRHLRPADQSARPAGGHLHRRRRPGLLPRHHQRRLLDPAVGHESVTPVVSSGVGPGNKFGYTEFTVTFDPTHQPNNGPSGIANFTGTYSYLIAPDDGANNPIVSPIDSFTDTLQNQPLVTDGVTTVNLPIPSKGTGGTGTNDDITISTINIPANYNNNANSPTRSSPASRSS